VQGLELDWTIVTWDADLRWRGSDWSFHSFRGAKWTDVKKPERRQYLKNAYRVLLTRARQGITSDQGLCDDFWSHVSRLALRLCAP
jgi:DUF2075 family protein